MNITIRLTKVEVEMLKELQKKDKRYKKGLEEKIKKDLDTDYSLRLMQVMGVDRSELLLANKQFE